MQEFLVNQKVKVNIPYESLNHWQKDVAKALHGMTGTIALTEPESVNGEPWMTVAHLVEFDHPSPKPEHPAYGPFHAFWFAPCYLTLV